MVNIQTFIFNPFQVNSYVLYDETKECIIIDPGAYTSKEQAVLSHFIETNGLKPVMLVNTHCHLDHICGNKYVKDTYGLSPFAHEADSFLVGMAVDKGRGYGFAIEPQPELGGYINEGELVKFGNSELSALHVPGHSPGSLVFYSKAQNFIVCGDVLFHGSIGRTDLDMGDYGQLIQGITQKLMVLDPETTVYSGHGPTTTIGYEKMNNMFLK